MTDFKYSMIRVPDYTHDGTITLAELLEQALFLAKWVVSVQNGGNIKSAEAERNDGLEAILQHFMADARPAYEGWLNDMAVRGHPYEMARWAAHLRDGFRCVMCYHRRPNAGGVECHHIVPRSSGGEDSTPNLVCLCSACHAEITHPTEGKHWRDMEPILKAKIAGAHNEE